MGDQAGNNTNDYESTITTGAKNTSVSFSCHPIYLDPGTCESQPDQVATV